MNLHDLTIAILSLNGTPMNRIRLSRAIYFVHKELVRKGIMKLDDLAYLRLPLGPVPEGFLTITSIANIVIHRITDNPLSYEAEEYSLKSQHNLPIHDQNTLEIIKHVLFLLKNHSTPELVETSHDHSWRVHTNGERYYLTPTDLKNTFPFPQIRLKIRIKGILRPAKPNEQGLLQANLVRGMLTDIVQESTDLEYPDDPNSNKPQAAKKSRKKS